ncbi:MAG: PAS domain S-box protein [Nannocystaceae bacterium]|nr:PAS domain S-box protein [Nannocystaceae bacterium]
MFEPDRLVDAQGFGGRLQGALDEAHARLGLSWIGVIELVAPEGRLLPRWIGAAPTGAPSPDAVATWPQSGPGPCARRLRLEPAIVSDGDAWLAWGGAATTPPELAALATCIERGMSADRRARLGEVALAALRQAQDAIELSDREGRLFFVNEAWRRTFGYDEATALGNTPARLFRDPDAPQHDPGFYRFSMQKIEAGHPWLGMLTSRAASGQHITTEVGVTPFADERGDFAGNLAVRRLLVHRAQRDAALAAAHREFRGVLAAMLEPAMVLRSRRIYFANAALLQLLGRDEAEVTGRHPWDFVHPDDLGQLGEDAAPARAEVRVVRSDGTLRLVELRLAGSISFEGAPAVILLGRDRTEQVLASEQLRRADKLAALGALAAGVAHEINNPLTYLIGRVQELTELLPPADAGALAREALEGAQRIKAIADELRGFSRGEDPSAPALVELERAVTSASNLVANQIRHRAQLQRVHEPGLCARMREGPAVQVLVNLLANAAQALPEQGDASHTIAVHSRAVGDDTVAIEVRDSGTGMTPEQIARMFEPFYTTKPAGKGSGLGLAISRQLVEDAGGRITVQSAPGRGTTVTVELPRAHLDAVVAAPARAPTGPRAAADAPARVLVVDDELIVAKVLVRMLRGHEVELAHDGGTALARLLRAPAIDLVLCDVMMPGMGGFELYRAAVAQAPALKDRFVFMTGGTFTPDAVEALAQCRCPLLEKPFDTEKVRATVAAVLAADGG